MQSGHSYLARSKARSRSPSPRRPGTEREHKECAAGEHGNDFLQVKDGGGQAGSKNDDDSEWAFKEGTRSNELLENSHPVDALVTVRRGSQTPSEASTRELIVKPHHSQSLGEMEDLTMGTSRNYGSISSSQGGQLTDTDNQSNDDNLTDNINGNYILRSKSPRLKRQKSYYTPSMVDDLRKRNKLYFLDPITKLFNFHGFPWKLTLQLIKLALITAQIIIFGGQRASIVEYFERSELAYKHLLLKDWDVAYETLPYPPAAGPYALYNMSDLFDHMNTVMERYYTISDWSLAAVHLNRDNATGEAYPIQMCFKANDFLQYKNGSYVVSARLKQNCTFVYPYESGGTKVFDIEKSLKDQNMTVPFNRTLEVTLKFYLRTFHLNLLETHYGPTCYNVSVTVIYTNSERSGQLLIDLQANPAEIDCFGKIMSQEAQDEQESMKVKLIAFDAVVMCICCFSTILCSRSLHRCNKLRRDTAKFFKLHKGKPFSFSNHMEYINMWYVIIICNDALTVIGTAFKIQLETRVFTVSSENYEICSILLGLGVFLTYVGILRYLGFFKSYNILILTLKTSFPHVLRFLVCAICLYTGFLFCGWVVFSPYHVKFRKLSTSSECLFSLVNGDDMFVTFSALNNNSNAIWYFHRAYLYIFISLFIYVVISVFIAVIMENYENLKRYYVEGFPDTEVQAFIKEDGEMPISELFRHVKRGNTWHDWFFCLFPCLACLRSRRSPYSSSMSLNINQRKTRMKSASLSNLSQERRSLLATI